MKEPRNFLTNTLEPAGRELGEAKNNPGDNSGTGVDHETYNDLIYSVMATIQSYKQGGNSGTDETLVDSDMRDALEELVNKKVSGIDDWNNITNYTVAILVMRKGFQYFGFNTTGNTNKDPLLDPLFWIKSPSPESLLEMFSDGLPRNGGMSNIADRDEASYNQNALIAKYRLGVNGDSFYNFYRVCLDGTVVTGNANLEAILDVGGLNEYWALDLIAPDVLGTRTLIDLGEVHGTSYIIAMLEV